MIGFASSLIPVDFRAILMSFGSFVSQKTNPGKFLRPEVILSRSYLRKCSICLHPPQNDATTPEMSYKCQSSFQTLFSVNYPLNYHALETLLIHENTNLYI